MQKEDTIPGSEPHKKVKLDENSKTNQLEQLKKHSIVVADTGDFGLIEQYLPEDGTTNPSLILQAAKNPAFAKFIDDSIEFSVKNFEAYQGGKKKKEINQVNWQEL